MSRLLDGMLSSHSLLTVLLDAAVKGTVVLALIAVLAVAWRRAPAASRHLIWALGVAGVFILPLLSALLPDLRIPLPLAWSEQTAPIVVHLAAPPPDGVAEVPPAAATVPRPPGTADEVGAAPLPTAPPPVAAETAALEVASQPPLSSWTLPLLAWFAGAMAATVPLLVGLLSLWRLRREAHPVNDGPMDELLRRLVAKHGLRRPVLLLQSSRRTMPMTWGILRPVILLPRGAESWSGERLQVVLRHELAHVLRWDCLTQFLAHAVRALHWFNPFAWLALHRLRLEQERACDDAVLNDGASPADYAEHLLSVTTGVDAGRFVSPVALAIGRARQIEERLLMILDAGRNRRPLSRRTGSLVVLALLCLLLPLAAAQLQTPAAARPNLLPGNDTPDTQEPAAPQEKTLGEVRTQIEQHYVKKPDEKALSAGALKGMLEALHDPYTEYLTPDTEAALAQQLAGKFTGIGAQLRVKDKRLVVISPLEDSPAYKAGLQPDDTIVAIDGKPTTGLELPAAIKLILGKQGTVVKLKVLHPDGKEAELAITRAPIQFRSVKGFRRTAEGQWEYLLDPDAKIGYVAVMQISASTPRELQETVAKLQNEKMKGLILDLRFCPGGLLVASLDVVKLFLARGKIVTIKGRGNAETIYSADGKTTLGDFPLLVLLNEHTASSAEIVAGALRDNDRAVLLGARSFGKGSVQEIVKLGDARGALKLTTHYYYLPSGRNILKSPGEKDWGVDPNDGYYVPLNEKQTEALLKSMQEREVVGKKPAAPEQDGKLTPQRIEERYADPQLAAALKTMQAKMTGGAFVKVGKGNAALLANVARREEIQRRRDDLLKSLEQVTKELAEVDKSLQGEKPPKEPQ